MTNRNNVEPHNAVSVDPKALRLAQNSIIRVSRRLGSAFAALPVTYGCFDPGVVAFTDDAGVWINASVVEADPSNVGFYIASEVCHHAIDDPIIRTAFPHRVVAQAEDYVVNLILHKVFRLDMRKVSLPGLYDKGFARKSLLDVCKMLVARKEIRAVAVRGVKRGLKNPAVVAAADEMRRLIQASGKFNHLGLHAHDLVARAPDSNSILHDAVARTPSSPVLIPNVSVDLAIRSLWARLYSKTVIYSVPRGMTVLPPTHTLAVSVDTSKLKPMTLGDADLSLAFSRHLVAAVEAYGTPNWKRERSAPIVRRLESLSAKLSQTSRYTKADRLRIRAQIERATTKLKTIETTPQISSLFRYKNCPTVKPTPAYNKWQIAALEDRRPKFKRNHLVKMIAKVTRQELKYLRSVHSVAESLTSYASSGPESGLSSIIETPDQNLDVKQQSDTETYVEPTSDQNRDFGSILDLARIDADDVADERTAASVDLTPDATPSASADSTSSTDETNDSGIGNSSCPSLGSGDGAGIGHGNSGNRRQRLIQVSMDNTRLLAKIFTAANAFESSFATPRRTTPDDSRPLDLTLSFGSDISRIDYGQLALLNSEYGKLAFFADLANSQLLQHMDIKPKLSSIIVAVDGSSSMGRRYATAAGFALALAKSLRRFSRDCSIFVFSGRVTASYTWTKDSSMDVLELATTLVSNADGGTNLDNVLSYGLMLTETYGWDKPDLLFITDGIGTFDPTLLLKAKETMNLHAVLLGTGATDNFKLAVPDSLQTRSQGLFPALVSVANRLL